MLINRNLQVTPIYKMGENHLDNLDILKIYTINITRSDVLVIKNEAIKQMGQIQIS